MQCEHCAAENANSSRICLSCGQRVHVRQGLQKPFKKTRPLYQTQFGFMTGLFCKKSGFVSRPGKFSKAHHLAGSKSLYSPIPHSHTAQPFQSDNCTELSNLSANEKPQSVASSGNEAAQSRHAMSHRTEPHFSFSEETHASSINPAYEALLREESASSKEDRGLLRNTFSRITLMFGIFAMGAFVGLGAAWWMKKASIQPSNSVSPSIVRPEEVSSLESRANSQPVSPRGINPSELPYDGIPQANVKPSDDALTHSVPLKEIVEGSLFEKTNEDAMVEGHASQSDKADDSTSTVKPNFDAGRTSASVTASAPVAKKNNFHANENNKVAAKTLQKHRPNSVAPKDREIERIKQQAAEELKKKTESREALDDAHVGRQRMSNQLGSQDSKATSTGRFTQTRSMIAKCEQIDNIISREKCKWRLCNGSWGKNGCPSYQTQAHFAERS